jgi:hypothetical protein
MTGGERQTILFLLNLMKPTNIFGNLYSFYSEVGMSPGGLR